MFWFGPGTFEGLIGDTIIFGIDGITDVSRERLTGAGPLTSTEPDLVTPHVAT